MNRTLPAAADLAIIMGTSLTVQPFASLPGFCSEGVPRLLVNSERVGGLGSRPDDVLLLGDCDEGVRKLASAIGWLEELEALFRTHHSDQSQKAQTDVPDLQDDRLDDEIAKITKDVGDSLRISSQHVTDMHESLSLPSGTAPEAPAVKDKEQIQSQTGTDFYDPPTVHHEKTDQSRQEIRPGESHSGQDVDEKVEKPAVAKWHTRSPDSAEPKSSL